MCSVQNFGVQSRTAKFRKQKDTKLACHCPCKSRATKTAPSAYQTLDSGRAASFTRAPDSPGPQLLPGPGPGRNSPGTTPGNYSGPAGINSPGQGLRWLTVRTRQHVSLFCRYQINAQSLSDGVTVLRVVSVR